MEHSPQTPSDDELSRMIAEQSNADQQTKLDDIQYERATKALWSAIDSLENHTLVIGRTATELESAVDDFQLRCLQVIDERDGPAPDAFEQKARAEAVYVMSAQRCQDHAEILDIITETLTDEYLAAEEASDLDTGTKKDLCARAYIDAFVSNEDAIQWLRTLGDETLDHSAPVYEADQWVAIINQAFEGDCFDRTNPEDLVLIMDILLEEKEEVIEPSPGMILAAEVMNILQTSPANAEIADSMLSTVIIPATATKILRIAVAYNDTPAPVERDAEIDELLRNEKMPATLGVEIKDACDRYRNNTPRSL